MGTASLQRQPWLLQSAGSMHLTPCPWLLQDAGFQQAFQPIRVKFKPSAKDVQVCEESGIDLAQAVRKKARKVQRQAGSGSGKSGEPGSPCELFSHAPALEQSAMVLKMACPVWHGVSAGLFCSWGLKLGAQADSRAVFPAQNASLGWWLWHGLISD